MYCYTKRDKNKKNPEYFPFCLPRSLVWQKIRKSDRTNFTASGAKKLPTRFLFNSGRVSIFLYFLESGTQIS